MTRVRGPFAATARRAAAWVLPAALAAALLAPAAAHGLAPALGDATAPGAAAVWLELALFGPAAAALFAALAAWPAFGARPPGDDWLRRLQRSPLAGTGAALAAAVAVQAAATAPLAAWLLPALGAPAVVAAPIAAVATGPALLAGDTDALAFAAPAGPVWHELRLRPLVGLPSGDFGATALQAELDGQPLGDSPLLVRETGQLLRLPFAPRAGQQLRVHRAAGALPIYFPAGAVELVAPAAHGRTGNAGWLAAVALLPTALALATAALLGAVAALPTARAAAAAVLFTATLGGIGPWQGAVAAALRGESLATAAVFRAGVPSLAVGGAAMICAMLLRRRRRW